MATKPKWLVWCRADKKFSSRNAMLSGLTRSTHVDGAGQCRVMSTSASQCCGKLEGVYRYEHVDLEDKAQILSRMLYKLEACAKYTHFGCDQHLSSLYSERLD